MDDDRGLDPHADKGYTQVDDQPDPSFLVQGMEATARWPAVVQLRAWERDRVDLQPGESLLDVGCGIADVARSLAPLVAPDGRVVGIDMSEAMLAVARERASADGVAATFRVGDAMHLDEVDGTFDACRSERMLQWVPDVDAAVAEMARVLRPGGRLCVTDTDWRTFALDLDDVALSADLSAALIAMRGAPALAGGRLLNACREAGLVDLEITGAVHIWDAWDPDRDPAPSGFFPLDAVVRDMAAAGHLAADRAEELTAAVYDGARRGRFCMHVTMLSVFGRRPA